MKMTMKVARGIGKVILALLMAALIPILVWVALGVALNNKLGERKTREVPAPTIGEILAKAGLTIQEDTTTDKSVAAQTFTQQPIYEIRELLAGAGLTIQDEVASRHCWEVLHCPPERQEACPTHLRRDVPCWVAVGRGKGGKISKEACVNGVIVDLKREPS